MTIIKGSSQKTEKAILEKKLLQEFAEESGETTPQAEVVVTNVQLYRKRRCCFNFFLILLALSVLAAGVVSGIYLYKHLSCLSKRHQKSHVTFELDTTTSKDLPYFLPEHQASKDLPDFLQDHRSKSKEMMEPYKPFNLDDFGRRRKNKHKKPALSQLDRFQVDKIQQDIEVEDKFERIHMPRFRIFKETLVLHDFTRNYSGIVDFEENVCYVMALNRENVTPPKDWFDLIRKFATGYYMPKASILRKQYRVAEGPLSDISRFGFYIEEECKHYNTYWLEKKVGDGLIEKRSAGNVAIFGEFDGVKNLIEHVILK